MGSLPEEIPITPIRVVIVEDEPLFLDLILERMDRDPRLRVVATYTDMPTAQAEALTHHPTAALVDVHLGPRDNGVKLGLTWRRLQPGLGIVLVSNFRNPEYLRLVPRHQLDGWGYLLKKTVLSREDLWHAIDAVTQGLLVLDPEVVAGVPLFFDPVAPDLSPRQWQILALMADGYSNQAIADQLNLAEKSVENHINTLYQLLHIDRTNSAVNSRVQAVRYYLDQRGSSPPGPRCAR